MAQRISAASPSASASSSSSSSSGAAAEGSDAGAEAAGGAGAGAAAPYGLIGGETTGLQRLEDMVGVGNSAWARAFEKPKTRSTSLDPPATTLLSPYLKFGCVSARQVCPPLAMTHVCHVPLLSLLLSLTAFPTDCVALFPD